MAEVVVVVDPYLQMFQTYRTEDRHECDLLSKRLTMFLTSQSFFIAATAVIYTRITDYRLALPSITVLALVGLFFAWLTFRAVLIGCYVLRQWHEHGKVLIESGGDALKGHYLPNRTEQPDELHSQSIDQLHLWIPTVMGAVWLAVLFSCALFGVNGLAWRIVLTLGVLILAFVWGIQTKNVWAILTKNIWGILAKKTNNGKPEWPVLFDKDIFKKTDDLSKGAAAQ